LEKEQISGLIQRDSKYFTKYFWHESYHNTRTKQGHQSVENQDDGGFKIAFKLKGHERKERVQVRG